MGTKDIVLKTYFRDTVRYADLWNAGVFHGKQIIRAEELQEITPVYSKADKNAVLSRTGDFVMMQSRSGQQFAILALENQEETDYAMPARIMIQEALEYDRQIKEIARRNERAYKIYCDAEKKDGLDAVYKDAGEYLYKFRKKDFLLPAVTLVVYFGEKEWNGAKSLHEMIRWKDTQTEAEFKKLIPKYPLHFLDLSSYKHFEYFRTELRPLFELYQKRNRKDDFINYIRENESHWKMDDESWHVLDSMIDAKSIKSLIKTRDKRKGESRKMCKALDDLIEESIIKGKAMGQAESIIDLLAELGPVPEDVKKDIFSQTDTSVLQSQLKLAAHAKSIDEFCRQSQLISVNPYT